MNGLRANISSFLWVISCVFMYSLCVPHVLDLIVLIYQVWGGDCMSVFPDVSPLFMKQNVLSLNTRAVIEWCGHCLRMWGAKDSGGKKGCFLAYSSCGRETCVTSALVNYRVKVLRDQLSPKSIFWCKFRLSPHWKFQPDWRSSIYLSFKALKTQQRHVWFMFHSKNFCTMC